MDKYPTPIALEIREIRKEKGFGFAFAKDNPKRIFFNLKNHRGVINRIPQPGDVIVAKIETGRQGMFINHWIFLEEMQGL